MCTVSTIINELPFVNTAVALTQISRKQKWGKRQNLPGTAFTVKIV